MNKIFLLTLLLCSTVFLPAQSVPVVDAAPADSLTHRKVKAPERLLTAVKRLFVKKSKAAPDSLTVLVNTVTKTSPERTFKWRWFSAKRRPQAEVEKAHTANPIALSEHTRDLHLLATNAAIEAIRSQMITEKNDSFLQEPVFIPWETESLIALSANDQDSVLLFFWTGGQGGGLEMINRLSAWTKQNPGIGLLTVCLDSNASVAMHPPLSGKNILHYCDFSGWETALVRDLTVTKLPFFVLLDRRRMVIQRSDSLFTR